MPNSNEENAGTLMLESINSNDLHTIEISITNFKQYIKRNLIDLNYALLYVNFLIETYNTTELSILSFGTLCHLIKRISIQDSSVLNQIYNPIIPFLINRLNDHKDSVRSTALKSLKVCLNSSPTNIDPIINHLINYGLINSDYQIQISVLDLFYEIINPNSKFIFSFKIILSNLILLLKSSNFTVSSKSSDLIKLYFNQVNPNNNTAKLDLLNDLLLNNIPFNISSNLLKSISIQLFNKYNSIINQKENKSFIDSSFNLNKLNYLLDQTPNWIIDDSSINSFDINDTSNFDNLVNEFEINFNGKETEKNWKNRQILIIKLRQILRGENFLSNLDNFIIFLKEIRDYLPKGMMSLRTTLSNNSCQFCKELAIYAGSLLDFNFIEPLFLILLKLTSARKIMQHQNANVAIISILLNTNLNPKIFTILNSTIQEKNIQPRVYVGNWVELILLKYYDSKNLDNNQLLFESVENLIIKGLSDPIPQVKEAMRNAFWTICEFDPFYENKIMKKLDYATIRALERTKSTFLNNNNNLLKSFDNISNSNNINQINNNFNSNIGKPLINVKQRQKDIISSDNFRKSERSESLDENKLCSKGKRPEKLEPQVQQQHTIRHHTIPGIKKNIEHSNHDDSIDEFTGRLKRENLIYEEITSDSKALQQDGFNKLLNENDSSLTIKFHSALNNLTVENPDLFDIIFTIDNEGYFKKISNYISTENMLRLFCFYLIKTEDFKRIDYIITNLSLEDLCLSITNILNFAIDASKIDNICLSIQYIKNKFKIINSILKIFNRLLLLKKNVIKSYLLSSILEFLIKSFGILNDEESKSKLIITFELCLRECNELFLRTLKEADDIILRNDIYKALNIIDDDESKNQNIGNNNKEDKEFDIEEEDTKILSPIKIDKEELGENIDEMTKIIPRLKNKNYDGETDENDCNKSNHNVISDFTMIIPKHKVTKKIIDYDNIELIDDEIARNSSVGVNELISELENEKEKEKEEGVDEDKDIKEERIDDKLEEKIYNNNEISMIDNKDDDLNETIPEDVVSMIEKEKIEEDNDISMLEKEKSLTSDSTPDINQLTIDEDKEVEGYLGIVLKELIEFNDEDNKEYSKFSWILQNINTIDYHKIFNELIEELIDNRYQIKILSLIRYFYEIYPDLINESIFLKFNEIINDDCDEIFIGISEIFDLFNIKKIISINKIYQLKLRLQEIIFKNIVKEMKENSIDCEDIFMIERIVKRGSDNEDSFIRMNSFLIYKEMYRMFINKVCDRQGMELVDNVIIDNMNEKIKLFIKL